MTKQIIDIRFGFFEQNLFLRFFLLEGDYLTRKIKATNIAISI